MTKVRLMQTQARKVLASRHLDLSSRHAAKTGLGSTGKIHSLSTFRTYSQVLGQAGKWMRIKLGLGKIDKMTPAMAKAYLAHRRSEGIGQKQLDNDRVAMQFMTGDLSRVYADREAIRARRSYSHDEADRIARCQSERNALATRVAYGAGLRAHELHTLRRADEDSPSNARAWRSDRFQGRSGVRYVVTGKGGLSREVLVSHELSRALEARRLSEPRLVTDRQIHYHSHYDIGGGQAWSNSFTKRSFKEFGQSKGAHGVRHGYAQSRFAELKDRGLSDKEAKLILSQELGHFRVQIVEVYLR